MKKKSTLKNRISTLPDVEESTSRYIFQEKKFFRTSPGRSITQVLEVEKDIRVNESIINAKQNKTSRCASTTCCVGQPLTTLEPQINNWKKVPELSVSNAARRDVNDSGKEIRF